MRSKQQKSARAAGGPAVRRLRPAGRDCAAESSAGELSADAAGEASYQHAFIDVIAAAFRAHPEQRIAVVLEPDSLSNLVTNLDRPRCKTAEGIYKRGIAYAISKLSLPNVFLYLEAAHAGWLGFPKNIDRAAALYKDVLTMAGGPDRVRGFALNVSNYDPAVDPAKTPRNRASAASDETGYADDLAKSLARIGITGKGSSSIPAGTAARTSARSLPAGATSRGPASASGHAPRRRRSSTPTST